MRRILAAAALIVALGWAAYAIAVEANSGTALDDDLICISSEISVSFSTAQRREMPSSYTLWSNDGTEFRFIRRFQGGIRYTVAILVPAGKSILIPAPDPIYEGGVYTHTIFIGGHTDTVYAAPWHK